MSNAAIVQLLSWVSTLLCGLVIFRLAATGLRRKYRVFFAYLIYRAVSGACLLVLGPKTIAYFYLYVLSAPVTWIFYGVVVLELGRLVLERHKGLYTLGRLAMGVGLVVSIAVSILTFMARTDLSVLPHSVRHTPSILIYISLVDRGVTCCLAVFLLLMLVLLSRYPVSLPRNVLVHTAVFSVYYWCNTVRMIVFGVLGIRLMPAIDSIFLVVSAVCVVVWLLYLTPQGEEVRETNPWLDASQERQVLLHLDAFNSVLLRSLP